MAVRAYGAATSSAGRKLHAIAVGLFVGGYGLSLWLLVEQLRGILGLGDGAKVALAGLAALALAGGYRLMCRAEAEVVSQEESPGLARELRIAIVLAPLLALLAYRASGALRVVGGGSMRGWEPWAAADTPLALGPLLIAAEYLRDTWFATLLGVLLGGAVLTVLPTLLRSRLNHNDWKSHLVATAFAMPNMFCSCCASPIAASLYRGGAALGPTLAFAVAAPALNVVTLLLAALLLPPQLAMVRIAGGLVVALPLTYLAAALALRAGGERRQAQTEGAGATSGPLGVLFGWLTRLIGQACHLDVLGQKGVAETPAEIVKEWAGTSLRIGAVLVPVLVLGYVAAGVLQMAGAAAGHPGQNAASVGIVALLGTMLMIPTGAEIPTALAFYNAGLPGMAVAALITLPPVSLPSLVVIGASIGRPLPVVLLGGLVLVLGFAAALSPVGLGIL